MDKVEEFRNALSASGINMEGVEFDEHTSLWDILKKIGCVKMIVADDARDFDLHDLERMEAEGRILHVIDMDEEDRAKEETLQD